MWLEFLLRRNANELVFFTRSFAARAWEFNCASPRLQIMQSAEITNLRCLSQEGEPSDVLQGLPARHVRVSDRALLLWGFHGICARVQTARHSAAAVAKGHEVSDRLGPVDEPGEFYSPFTLIAHFARRQVRPPRTLSRRQKTKKKKKNNAHAEICVYFICI